MFFILHRSTSAKSLRHRHKYDDDKMENPKSKPFLLRYINTRFVGWFIFFGFLCACYKSLASNTLKSNVWDTDNKGREMHSKRWKENQIFIPTIQTTTANTTEVHSLKTNNLLESRHQLPNDELFKNPQPFDYVVNAENPCSEMTGWPIIIFVQSAAAKHNERDLIRQTWGSVREYRNVSIRTVFMVAVPPETEDVAHHMILKESTEQQDIVQINFVENYRNLTYKHTMSLLWIHKYCPGAKMIIKADDDTFLNVAQLMKFINNIYINSQTGDLPTHFLYCSVLKNHKPRRYKNDKWYVPISEYPDKDYPPYCEGFAYIMSPDLALPLYNASLYTNYFWVDDVYVTGILAKQLGIVHKRFVKPFAYTYGQATKDYVKNVLFFLSKYNNVEQYTILWGEMWNVVRTQLDENK